MTTLERFTTADLFRFNSVNLDVLTETYQNNFYLQYLARWPEYFIKAESACAARARARRSRPTAARRRPARVAARARLTAGALCRVARARRLFSRSWRARIFDGVPVDRMPTTTQVGIAA